MERFQSIGHDNDDLWGTSMVYGHLKLYDLLTNGKK